MDRGLSGPQIEIRQELTDAAEIRNPNNRSSASNTKASTPPSKKPPNSRRASAALLEQFVGEIDCSECGGSRLRDAAAAVRFRDRTLDQIGRTPLGELITQVKKWKLAANEKKVAGELIREIENRLTFLVDVGLDYLTLGRAAPTLSGGEAQRIRLASQVGSGLCGVLYVLDEPTIGLHPRDNSRLIAALKKLRDLGNTLLIVEHDREVIASSDGLFDFGPGAGRLGGQIVASGTPEKVSKTRGSVTGPYLSGKKAIGVPKSRRRVTPNRRSHRSRRRTPQQPQKHQRQDSRSARFTAFTGVSGSGKSSLVEDILYNQLAKTLHRASTVPGAHESIRGIEQINKVIRVDQQPLGNTPTSNPATYTGVFDLIRTAVLATARIETPRLHGPAIQLQRRRRPLRSVRRQRPDLHPDALPARRLGRVRNVPRPALQPRRARSPLPRQIIADVLDMSCGQAVELFGNIPKIRRILQTLCDVGLDYLTLGQSAPTLSGGEAQRVKLAAELARPDTGQTLYLLDEPTTGLHFDDLAKLLEVLNRLVDHGNTVVVIEHNLDVIKTADWVIDIGPEAGAEGGTVVACGTPEQIVEGGMRNGGRRKAEAQSDAAFRHSALPTPHSPPTPPSPSPPSSPPARSSNASRTTPKPPIAPQPDDLEIDDVGRDTQHALGSRRPPMAHARSRRPRRPRHANGTAASSTPSNAASRKPATSPKPIGTTARSSKSPPPKNPTAGSSTPSPANAG